MTIEQSSATPLRGVPTLWFTVAFNAFALWTAVALIALGNDVGWLIWLPVASLALSGGVGVASVVRRRTRPFGVGCLCGTAVSALSFLVLVGIFFVTHFIVPGAHELS